MNTGRFENNVLGVTVIAFNSTKSRTSGVDCMDDLWMDIRSMIDKLLKALRDMLPNRERRKKKFFESARTNERTDKDGNKILMVEEVQDKTEPILCPMHEDYDEVDYRAADQLDEVAAIERMRKDK